MRHTLILYDPRLHVLRNEPVNSHDRASADSLPLWQIVLCIWLLCRGLGPAAFSLVLSMIRIHLVCPVVIVLAGCAGLTPGPGVCLAIRVHLVGTVVLTCFVLQMHLRRQILERHSYKRDIWHGYAHTGPYADWQGLIQQIWHVI